MYEKQEWSDVYGETPFNATRMKHIEDGIYNNSKSINGVVLYENEDGTNEDIILNDNAGNYKFIEIYGYRLLSTEKVKGSVKVDNPNGSIATLSIDRPAYSELVVNTTGIISFLINGTSMSKVGCITYNLGHGNDISITSTDATTIYVTKVIGYK